YTSGSTGTPKGVASTHTGWANRIQWMQAHYPLNPGERVLHKTVLSFDDSAVEILWPLIAGATTVMIPPGLHRDPRAIADWATHHHTVALHFVPSMLTLFLDEITPQRQNDLTHLRYVISSGEALRPDLVYLAGTGLARGYLNDPRKTATTFLPHPHQPGQRLYRTGDRGIRHTNGHLTFLGRTDHQIKIRGIRIEPAEIEHTLRRHPHINNAVITKWEPTPGDHRLAAYITLEPQEEAAPHQDVIAQLNTYLADQLPIYMIPSSITVLDRIPTNANGKTDLHALPEPCVHDGEKAQLPRTEAERLVAGVWAEVLGRDDLDVNADFYALGGHSLLATRIVSRLRA
ncbi:non-ribosomal peptide synthetase, partial [Streptomyces sp. MBT33]|uniref:non-ribosomal peptide synthetase n=1 Tax=Streptomyces sp. MBT33 TaxID=1488363 RepID=UPI00190DBBBC